MDNKEISKINNNKINNKMSVLEENSSTGLKKN